MADNIVNHSMLNTKYYTFEVTFIDEGINEKILDMSSTTLSVENDYRANFFPILRLELILDKNINNIILNKKNTLKVRIILKSYIKGSTDTEGMDRKSEQKVVFDHLFQPIISDISKDTRSDMTDQTVENEGPVTYKEIYLFKCDDMEINKKIVNFIAQKCKPKDAIGYILQQTGAKNVLMMKPDVDEVYEQIFVPPLNLKNAVKFVAENYGLYSTGVRQFYDFNEYYILSNNVERIPTTNEEYTNVYINVTKLSGSNSVNEGSYKDDVNKCYIVNVINNVYITNNGAINKEISGNSMKTYSRQSVEKSVSYDQESGKFSIDKGYEETEVDAEGYGTATKTNYIYNSSGTTSKVNEYATQVQYSNTEFTLQFNVLDLDIFKLNRVFIFRFEENDFASSYNGRYILEAMTYVLENKNGSIQGICKFRKVD